MNFLRFLADSARLTLRGGNAYFAWVLFLVILVFWGGVAYVDQLSDGLIMTSMRDEVSWAFYIGNFTFLVGVAAAAVLLVIPALIVLLEAAKAHLGTQVRRLVNAGVRPEPIEES